MNATTPAPIDPRAHIPWLAWTLTYGSWTADIDGFTADVDDVGIQLTRVTPDGQVRLALSETVESVGATIASVIQPHHDADSRRVLAEMHLIRLWRRALTGAAHV